MSNWIQCLQYAKLAPFGPPTYGADQMEMSGCSTATFKSLVLRIANNLLQYAKGL